MLTDLSMMTLFSLPTLLTLRTLFKVRTLRTSHEAHVLLVLCSLFTVIARLRCFQAFAANIAYGARAVCAAFTLHLACIAYTFDWFTMLLLLLRFTLSGPHC